MILRVEDYLCPIPGASLGEDAVDVRPHRVRTDIQRRRDATGCASLANEREHLDFAGVRSSGSVSGLMEAVSEGSRWSLR